jgi:hypothetical protein
MMTGMENGAPLTSAVETYVNHETSEGSFEEY